MVFFGCTRRNISNQMSARSSKWWPEYKWPCGERRCLVSVPRTNAASFELDAQSSNRCVNLSNAAPCRKLEVNFLKPHHRNRSRDVKGAILLCSTTDRFFSRIPIPKVDCHSCGEDDRRDIRSGQRCGRFFRLFRHGPIKY